MAAYTVANLKADVENMAEKFGLAPDLEARFARKVLGSESSGVSYQKLAPGFRVPFGHKHEQQEETYVVLSGSGRLKLDDEVIDVEALDAIRVSPGTWRGIEAGDDGIELVAFGARCGLGPEDNDSSQEQGWWSG